MTERKEGDAEVSLGNGDSLELDEQRAAWKRFFASMLDTHSEMDDAVGEPVAPNDACACLTLPRQFVAATARDWQDEELAHISECRSCQWAAEIVGESLESSASGRDPSRCVAVTALVRVAQGEVDELGAAHLFDCEKCQRTIAAVWRSTRSHPTPATLVEYLAYLTPLAEAVAEHLGSGCYLCGTLINRSEALRTLADDLVRWSGTGEGPIPQLPAGAAWDVDLPRAAVLWDTQNEPRFYRKLDSRDDLTASLRETDNCDFVVEVWAPELDGGTVELEIMGATRTFHASLAVRPAGWPRAEQTIATDTLNEMAGRCAILVMRPPVARRLSG